MSSIYLILALTIFIGYCATITIKYGWLPSISESFYHLPKKLSWIFSIFLWVISILIIAATWETRLIVIACWCIMGVGVFPYFLDTRWIHYLFALTGFTIGLISVWINFNGWYFDILFLAILLYILLAKVKHRIFWIEVIAFLTIIISIFVSIINF